MAPVLTGISIRVEVDKKKKTWKPKEVHNHPCNKDGIHIGEEDLVTFEATDDCTLVFDNPGFFGMDHIVLQKDKEITLKVQPRPTRDEWQTFYSVAGMPSAPVSGDPDPVIQP